MVKHLALFPILVLIGCGGKPRHEAKAHGLDLELLETKREVYLLEAPTVQDGDGFFTGHGCDSLLFTALGSIGGAYTDLMAARHRDGRWHRTPAGDCYPLHSKSTISKDMLLGVMFWAFVNQRLDVLEHLYDYGSDHGWRFGEGPLGRVYMTPNLRFTLADAIRGLGGSDHLLSGLYPFYASGVTGYEAALMVTHILFRGEIHGKISEGDLDRFKEHAARSPRNALFQYALHRYTDGDQSAAIASLMDQSLFPDDRLPSSSERCEAYLWQRDEKPKDWAPCPDEGRTHSGADFLFVSKLIMDSSAR